MQNGSVSVVRDGLRLDVQGLRGVAVIAVIVFHINKDWLPGGFVGVDVFFVISGFLIGSIILKAKSEGRFSLLDFYLGRVRRIVPAYSALLVFLSLTAAILFLSSDFKFFLDSLKYSAIFFSNHYFSGFGDYFSPKVYELPLLHTWSLAVEMQFYVLFPLIVAFVPLRYLKVAFPIIIISLTVYTAYGLMLLGQRQSIYFSLLARIPEFLVGANLALFRNTDREEGAYSQIADRSNNIIGFIGIGLVFSGFFLINEAATFPGFAALIPSLGVAFILVSRGVVSEVLKAPVLVWLGGISYSLYLWHWPVLSVLRYMKQSYRLSALDVLLFSAITFALSYFSWRLIETPLRRKEFYVNRYRLILATLSLVSLTLSASTLNASFGRALPVGLTRYAAGEKICHGKMIGDCLRGDRSSESDPVLVLGDSHAAQLNLFFDVVGNKNGQRFRVITGSSCITITGFDVDRLPEYARTDCLSQIIQADRYVTGTKKIVLAGMWQYHYDSPSFLHAFEKFLANASANGQHVLVMAQIPMLNSNVQRVIRFNDIGLPLRINANSDWRVANSRIREICASYNLVRFVDLSSHEMFSSVPFERDQLIYQDNHHLNEVGAMRYGWIAAPLFSEM